MVKKQELIDERTVKIGNRIKQLRQQKYDSAEKFAYDHELPRISYELQEKGKRNMTLSSLYRILDVHKISLSEFFKGL
jgi:transcriptional regulator with XRE-family HTH domain